MRYWRFLWAFVFCLAFSAATSSAQTKPASAPAAPTASIAPATVATADPTTPAEFFARARQLSDLEASGIPFHLKATFVATGDKEFAGNGTYEEWWKDKNTWRKEATLGDFRYVAFKNGGEETKVYSSARFIPWHITQVLNLVLIRFTADVGTSSNWKMSQKKLQGTQFTVISDHNQQYFFTAQGLLRMKSAVDTQLVYNNLQYFQKMAVARTIAFGDGDKKNVLTISIGTAEALSAEQQTSAHIAAVPTGLRTLEDQLGFHVSQIGDGVTPPTLTKRVDTAFPESIRRSYRSLHKSVVVEAIVDEKGNVWSAGVVLSAGADLDNSALTAVRQYKFKPAEYKGSPVPVMIDTIFNFHIGR